MCEKMTSPRPLFSSSLRHHHHLHHHQQRWSILPQLFVVVVLFISIASSLPDDTFLVQETTTLSVAVLGTNNYTINTINKASTTTEHGDDDKICVNYLKNFLQNHTNVADQCEEAKDAIKGANCTDFSSPGEAASKHEPKAFGTVNSDYVLSSRNEEWHCCTYLNHYVVSKGCSSTITDSITDYRLLIVATIFVVCGLVKSIIRKYRLHWVPEAVGCILVGASAGALWRLMGHTKTVDDLAYHENIFMVVLLPPIVFSSALSIDKRSFRLHSIPIVMYAFLGTLISAAVTGGLVYGITNAFFLTTGGVGGLPLLESFLFGTLISSIDPVVVLNVLDNVGVNTKSSLYVILFGESLLNDGIVIALFQTLLHYLGSLDTYDDNQIWPAVLKFLGVLVGSILVGLATSVCANAIFWYLQGHMNPVLEVSMFIFWAFSSYYICGEQVINLSPIIALVTSGFFMDIYVIGNETRTLSVTEDRSALFLHSESIQDPIPEEGHPVSTYCTGFLRLLSQIFSMKGQLSPEGRNHAAFIFEVFSSMAEMLIFAYIGAFLFSEQYDWSIGMNAVAVFACVSGRATMVVVVSAITNVMDCIGCGYALQRVLGICRRTPPRRFRSNGDNGRASNRVQRSDDTVGGYTTATLNHHVIIDRSMQLALISSGLRGAVSLALVESIPIYNAVTEKGTKFRPELRSMTCTCILFTIFIFGGVTHRLLTSLGLAPRDVNSRSQHATNTYSGLGEPFL